MAGGRSTPLSRGAELMNSTAMVPAVQVNPATSTNSVGGICTCADRQMRHRNQIRTAGTALFPRETEIEMRLLSNGSPEIAAKRPFHIMSDRTAYSGRERRATLSSRPLRSGRTILLFWMPITIDCVSPNASFGEWTATAGVVVVEALRIVEPQKPAEMGRELAG